MAREINRLNARVVQTIREIGRHADGANLYLSISSNGGRRWVFLYRWRGKPTEIGFGSVRDVTLARARELASQARAKLAEGINPKEARKPSEGATFGECADRVIEAMRPSWRNCKHAGQWEMTLRDYAARLRALSVDKITTDDVLSVLKPIWNSKPETASRIRRLRGLRCARRERRKPETARQRSGLQGHRAHSGEDFVGNDANVAYCQGWFPETVTMVLLEKCNASD